MLYELTEAKEKQLQEREEVLQGSNRAIQEMHQRDMEEIREELQRQYNYIGRN